MSDTGANTRPFKDIENKFYEFLKDAQPLAFLASFSMVIAVFAFPNTKFGSVFEYASLASAMFLISFIVSLIGRIALFGESVEKSHRSMYTDLARYGVFFFFGIGIICLVLILIEFSKIISFSITSIALGWIPLFMGITIFFSVKTGVKDKLKNGSHLQKTTTIIFLIIISLLVFYGVRTLLLAFGVDLIPNYFSHHFTYLLLGSISASIVLAAIQNKKTKGSFIDPEYKPGKTGDILAITYAIIGIIILLFLFYQINTNTTCDEKCKTKFETLGFLCFNQENNNFSCRFIADKPIMITIPNDASIPNDRNFFPSVVVVSLEVNSTIHWINLDKNTHKIISDDNLFLSKDLFTDDIFTYRFTKAGVYDYHGDLPWLKGKIIVKNIDMEYQKGKPLEQITNEYDVFYKIFRDNDSWGTIEKITRFSDHIVLNLQNQTKQPMRVGDTFENCLKNNDLMLTSNMTLVEINNNNSYVIFKEIRKNEQTRTCYDVESN